MNYLLFTQINLHSNLPVLFFIFYFFLVLTHQVLPYLPFGTVQIGAGQNVPGKVPLIGVYCGACVQPLRACKPSRARVQFS